MANGVIIVGVSAVGGGIITLIATYLNNKAKRFELEYNYRKKLEERYLSNAQKHLDDVYIPLYSMLITFQNNWTKSKNSNIFQNLKNEITELENFKKNLEEKGLTAYLTLEVENSFDQLLGFLSKSQDANEVRYAKIDQINILGVEESIYRVYPEGISRKRINFYRRLIPITNFAQHINWMYLTGLMKSDRKIILDSAPLNSKDFDDQLSKFLIDIKEKVKDITLGTK